MSILRNPNRHRYTIVDSLALEDPSISFEAKGVLAYLLSKPDGWKINQGHLSNVGGIGRHKILRIFSELRKAGYIAYNKPRNELGHVEGTEIVLCETPSHADADPVAKPDHRINRESENPTVGKPAPLVSIDLSVNPESSARTDHRERDHTPPTASPLPRDGRPAPVSNKPKPATANGTRLPSDWFLSTELGEWALAQGMSRERIRQEADKFRDYWTAKPGAAGRKLDWDATFRNWIRRSLETAPGGHASGKYQRGAKSRIDGTAIDLHDTSWLTDEALEYIWQGAEIGERQRARLRSGKP